MPTIINSKGLVRKICEMRCWYLVWQTSQLYVYPSHSTLPRTALWELKKMAVEELIACEKEVLLELDDLPPDGARLIELPLWACVWQMILIYRQLFAGLSTLAQPQVGKSGNPEETGE